MVGLFSQSSATYTVNGITETLCDTHKNKEKEYKLTNNPKYAMPVSHVCKSVSPKRCTIRCSATPIYAVFLSRITSLHSNSSSSWWMDGTLEICACSRISTFPSFLVALAVAVIGSAPSESGALEETI
jgi:hypothetical protein